MSSLALLALTALLTTGWGGVATVYLLRLRRLLHRDEVTGIGNRVRLHRVARRRNGLGLVGLLLLDLDKFKRLNDRHGHHFGNRVLAAVAARLVAVAEPGEMVVRLHGDEFALWLGPILTAQQAERRRDAVVTALLDPLEVDGQQITARGTVGAAVALAQTSLVVLLQAADRDMYRRKRNQQRPEPGCGECRHDRLIDRANEATASRTRADMRLANAATQLIPTVGGALRMPRYLDAPQRH